jgi:beta-galactosidase
MAKSDVAYLEYVIAFSAEKDFLNETVELVGGCFHHDNGPLGSKAIDAEERRIELFEESGTTLYDAAIILRHPSRCMLVEAVIDEMKLEEPKVSRKDYSQFFKNGGTGPESMIIRAKCHR